VQPRPWGDGTFDLYQDDERDRNGRIDDRERDADGVERLEDDEPPLDGGAPWLIRVRRKRSTEANIRTDCRFG
jgi:hypothetical protein